MYVTFVAGETSVGERARRTGHAIAASLVTDVCYINPTTFVARLTDVSSCHSSRYVRDYVIMSIDIIIEYVKTFRRVNLTFEHYIVTTETSINK